MKCKMCEAADIETNVFGNMSNIVHLPLRQDKGDGEYWLSRILVDFYDKPVMCTKCKMRLLHAVISETMLLGEPVLDMTEKAIIEKYFDCIDKGKLVVCEKEK